MQITNMPVMTRSRSATLSKQSGTTFLSADAQEELLVAVLTRLLHPLTGPIGTDAASQGVLVAYFPEPEVEAPPGFPQQRASTQDLLRASQVCKRWRRVVIDLVVRSVHAASLEIAQFPSLALFLQRAAPSLRSVDVKMSLRFRWADRDARWTLSPAPEALKDLSHEDFYGPFIQPHAAQFTRLTSLTLPAYDLCLGLQQNDKQGLLGLPHLRITDAMKWPCGGMHPAQEVRPRQVGTLVVANAGAVASACEPAPCVNHANEDC